MLIVLVFVSNKRLITPFSLKNRVPQQGYNLIN